MANIFKITVIQYWVYDCWIDTEGRPCDKDAPGARFVKSRKVKAGTPGAQKVKKRSGKWYGRVPGNTRPVPLAANQGAHEMVCSWQRATVRWLGEIQPHDPTQLVKVARDGASHTARPPSGTSPGLPRGRGQKSYRQALWARGPSVGNLAHSDRRPHPGPPATPHQSDGRASPHPPGYRPRPTTSGLPHLSGLSGIPCLRRHQPPHRADPRRRGRVVGAASLLPPLPASFFSLSRRAWALTRVNSARRCSRRSPTPGW